MKIAIAGATGLVGRKMIEVLEEMMIQPAELILSASPRSEGLKIDFMGKPHTVVSMQSALDQNPDIVLFSAGGETSKEWAPKFAKNGSSSVTTITLKWVRACMQVKTEVLQSLQFRMGMSTFASKSITEP